MKTSTQTLASLPADLSYFSLCQIQGIFPYADPRMSIKRLPGGLVEVDELGNVYPLGFPGRKVWQLSDAQLAEVRAKCGANL